MVPQRSVAHTFLLPSLPPLGLELAGVPPHPPFVATPALGKLS